MRLNFYSSIVAGIDNALAKAQRVEGSYIRNIELSVSEYAKMVTEIVQIKDREIQMDYKRRFKVSHLVPRLGDKEEYTIFNFFNPTEEFCNAWINDQVEVTYCGHTLNLVQEVNNEEEKTEQET